MNIPLRKQEATPVVRTQQFKASSFKRWITNCDCYARYAIKQYLTGEGGIAPGSPYIIKGDELWFCRRGDHKVNALLAKKINGVIFGNSSGLAINAKGRLSDRGRQLAVQGGLAEHLPMLPFVVFEDAGLDPADIEIIEQGPQETLQIKQWKSDDKTEERHFTGALLFSIGGKCYLFDIDRNEVEIQNFNVWMSELPRPCHSIREAYRSLKPDEVSQAEKFLKAAVPRQGEWFFIPSQATHERDGEKEGVLEAKGSRAHTTEEISVDGFVRGKVQQGRYGGDHFPLHLKGWHKPVPNGAAKSFKISGAID